MKSTRHIPAMAVLTLLVMSLVEYMGWMIVARSPGKSAFPGFLSAEVLHSVLTNAAGAFLFGLLFTAFAIILPSFRRKWRERMHIPVWTGILFFSVYMLLITSFGLV